MHRTFGNISCCLQNRAKGGRNSNGSGKVKVAKTLAYSQLDQTGQRLQFSSIDRSGQATIGQINLGDAAAR